MRRTEQACANRRALDRWPSNSHMAGPSEQLVDLAFFALDHGIKSVAASNGPLIPFAIIESGDGKRVLMRFTTGQNPEEARHHARAHVAQTTDCVRYAVVADGIVTEQNARMPVVMAEVGQRGDLHGFSFIQRFTSTPEFRFGQPIRNPSIIDQPAILQSNAGI
jgi:hypothetical protein